MERVGGTPKQRRIIAVPGTGDGSRVAAAAAAAAAAAGAELTAPASTATGGRVEMLATSRVVSSSPYSPAASATPIRHRRDNPTPGRETTLAAAGGAAAAAAAVNGRLSPPPSPPFRPAATDTSPFGRDEPKYNDLARNNNAASSSSSSNGNSGFRPASSAARASAVLCHRLDLLDRRVRRLLRVSRWRTSAARLCTRLDNRLSRLLRHRLGRRLVAAAAVLIVGLLWFLVITAVAGPAGGSGGGGSGGITGGANGGKGGEKDGAGQRIPSYYRKIAGEVGVGPSLTDPWVVREIEIAAADWGLEVAGVSDGEGDGGAAKGIALAGGVEGALVVGSATAGARGREEWDGRVNTIVTGDLQPAGGAKTRPKVDLLLVIFSGTSEPNIEKRELLRQIYDKYEGWVKVGGANSITGGVNPEKREFTFSVVFVMSKETAPPEGELVGDILYVPVPEGYRNIVLKTRAMLCLVRHFDFQFLLKADDDSFVCVARIASMLHDLDPEIAGKIYAGVPTACNQSTNPDFWNGRVMKNPDHRWFDSKFVQHTLGGLDCFPAYMQGAFYILAYPLVEHLYRGHEHLECFTNEDVTIGSWLMGVDREIVEMYNLLTSHLWDCLCARTQITARTRRKQMFFHNCKGLSQLKLCGSRLLRPGIGC